MTAPAETVGNGSNETEAANKTDKVVSISEAFGYVERVLDEVESSKNIGQVLDINKGVFPEHVRMTPYINVDGQELALRDHMRNSSPATAIVELLTRGKNGEELVLGTVGSSKVWEHDAAGKHVLVPESKGIPAEFATTINSVAEAVHERIQATEAQQQLSAIG